MYIVIIYNGGSPAIIHGERHKLPDAKVTRERNSIGAFDFSLTPKNPGWDLLSTFSTLVEVIDSRDGSVEFEGRVIKPSPAMEQDGMVVRTVTCESVEGYLLDSTQTYQASREWSGAKAFLTHLLAVHNGKMPEHKQVQLGSVMADESFTREVNRGKTWDAIKSLADDLGAEFRVRRSNGALYLDFGLKIGTTRATPIKLGRNMKTARREVNPNAVITRLYPYGAKITVPQTDANGETTDVQTEERVGIESVNDGKAYIEDAVAIEEYGIIEGEVFFDDIGDPLELMQAGAKWLGNNNKMPVSTTIDALDLSLLGIDPDEFKLLDWYPCVNQLIDLDDELEIVKHVIDVCNPANSTFDMGEVTELVSKNMANLGQLNQKIEVVKDQLTTQVVNVGNKVESTKASISTMENSIQSKVEKNVEQTIVTRVQEEVKNLDLDAVGIKSATVGYQAGTSGTEVPTGDWLAEVPEVPEGQYLWTRTQTTYTNEDQSTAYSVSRMGSQGEDGASVASFKSWYVLAEEAPEKPTANPPEGWSETEPTVDLGTDYRMYRVDLTERDDGTWSYSEVTLSSSFDGTKAVYEITNTHSEQIANLIQSSEGWTFNFETMEKSVTELNGVISTEVEERLKYIKFIDGEIWLGKDPDEGEQDFKLRISNQRISFLLNNIEVAYFADDALHVETAYLYRAYITKGLYIGGVLIESGSDGNVNARWIG